MEENQQAEGVTQNIVEALNDGQDSTPESIETGSQENEKSFEQQAVQPGSKEYNFKQMRENLTRLETERNQLLQEKQQLSGASELDKWIRSDPKNFEFILGLRNGHNPQELAARIYQAQKAQEAQKQDDQSQIDFERYEPETAKILKTMWEKASALEQWKSKFEQQTEQTQKQAQEERIQNNIATLDTHFDSVLVRDGFLDKQGNGDPAVVQLIRSAVKDMLTDALGDARIASKEQVDQAYGVVTQGLSALQKQTLKKTVKTDVPLSGSRKGGVPTNKARMTEEERISSIVNDLQG